MVFFVSPQGEEKAELKTHTATGGINNFCVAEKLEEEGIVFEDDKGDRYG